MKLRTLGLLSLALTVCLSSALLAQNEGRGQGRGQGRGGPGGPGGGRGFGGGMGMTGGALELIGLLRMEEVQKEVGMTPEVYQAVQGAMPDMRELFQASEEERPAKIKEANAKAQEMLDEVLSPDRQKRLMGLLVQQNGMRAATNDLVAKEVGIDAPTMEKVKAVAAKAGEESRAKMREAFSGGGAGGGAGGFDREKMRELMEASQKEIDQAIAATLTDAHKKALEDLRGDKFTFPERPAFGGRGGAGAPGGGRGAGGARTRPGSDNSN